MTEENLYKKPCSAWYVKQGFWTPSQEMVAVEVPVGLRCDGRSLDTMWCTPCDLEDLAYGALFTQGFIADACDVASLEKTGAEGELELAAVLVSPSLRKPPAAGYAEAALRSTELSIQPRAVYRASSSMLAVQAMHRETGATHAAVFADRAGAIRLMREDVGRHNAVDKLVGALARGHEDARDGFVHLSSRCALELVKKCACCGVQVVSTVSAPTTAVLNYAEERGITLCAFSRNDRFTVYTHPERLQRRPVG